MEENKITAEGIISEALACSDVLSGSDFPLHIFPAKFQEIARTTSHCLGYPLDFVAQLDALCGIGGHRQHLFY